MTDKIKPVTPVTIVGHAKNGLPTCTIWEGKPSPEIEQRVLPAMTGADWELLQELHKARKGEGTATIQFAPHTVTGESPDPALFPSYDKQYESLARPVAGSMSPAAVEAIAKIGAKPEMNWQAVAADLQDQIGDWETKCKQLETKCANKDQYIKELAEEVGKLRGALSVTVQLKDDAMRQNAELSKSLQHYRNAYFADQGKEGDQDAE